MESVITYLGIIGTYASPYLPYSDLIDSAILGAIVAAISVFVILFSIVHLFKLLAFLTRPIRAMFLEPIQKKRKQIDEASVDIELIKKKNEIHLARIDHKNIVYRIKLNNSLSKIGFFRTVFDAISGIVASTAPPIGLLSELTAFKSRVSLINDAKIGSLKAKLVELDLAATSAPERFNSAKSSLIEKIDADIEELQNDIDESLKSFNAIDTDESDPDFVEEKQAEEIVLKWEKRLGRSAYFDNFNAFFEKNINKWIESQPWSRPDKSDSSSEQGSDSSTSPNKLSDTIKLYVSTIYQSILKGVTQTKDLIKSFVLTAMFPEMLYSYTPFEVLVNGDKLAAISGTVVFTLGIMTVGQMCGFAFLRARYREGDISTSEPRWRITVAVSALLLFLFGCYVVYTGATLRGTTGDIIRIKQDIETLQISQASVDLIEKKRRAMNELIRNPAPPFSTIEGEIAIFIYGVFFLSSLTARIFANDPVFEYGLATQWLSHLRRRRLEKKWATGQYISFLRALKLSKKKERIGTEKEEYTDSYDAQKKLAEEELSRLADNLTSYANVRVRTFANYMMKIRRSHAQKITQWLEQNST